ncbi:MBL fold metallo-hydrolase [Sporolactobacillus sp. THM7-7]|nr:MBL fold metallo-hydrolase [Sporolactobacillus sp. THM7-7]
MKWMACPVGPIQANCYVLEDEQTKEALIIDPGSEMDRIASIVGEKKLHPLAILLTHAHFDHIGALDPVRDRWHIPAYLHENEKDWPQDSDKNGSALFTMTEAFHDRPVEYLLTKEETMDIGPFTFDILETPGHSPGGVSFYFKEANVVFCGDALFNGSIGRTDIYAGDQMQLLQSITTKLLTLPPDTVVCPGHGFTTTIGHEAETNPFLI